MKSVLGGALALATILAGGSALATTVTSTTGFLSTYTGPKNGDLDLASVSATIEGADLQGAHRGFDIAVRGDHGHRSRGAIGLDPCHQVQSIAIRQPHVGQA